MARLIPKRYRVTAEEGPNLQAITIVEFAAPENARMIDLAEGIFSEARKNVASRKLDYDSFTSDSSYLEELDRITETITILRVEPYLTEQNTFRFRGSLDGEGEEITGALSASTIDEADFQSRWKIAEAIGYHDKNDHDQFIDVLQSITLVVEAEQPNGSNTSHPCHRTEIGGGKELLTLVREFIEAKEAGHNPESAYRALKARVDGIGNNETSPAVLFESECDTASDTTYEVVCYANQEAYDRFNGVIISEGLIKKQDALTLGQSFLGSYGIVKIQSSDREFLELLRS